MAYTSNKRTHIKTSMKLRLIVSALILLILALGFNTLLSLNSLEKLYVESLVSQYKVIGNDLQRNIESSLRFGKNIKTFIGMNKILEETKQKLAQEIAKDTIAGTVLKSISTPDISVSVSLPDGSLIYSTNEALIGTTLPEQAQIHYEDPQNDQNSPRKSSYVKYQNTYIAPLPIHDIEKQWVATAIIMFDEKQVKVLLNTVRNDNIKLISIILVCSIIFLILFLNLVTRDKPGVQKFPKRKISLVMFLVIGSAQIVFSGLNTNTFRNDYLQINKEKAAMLITLLKEDIEFLLSKGIHINKLVKMDALMGEIIEASPELNDITILDKDDTPLYMATKKGVVDFQNSTEEEQTLIISILVDPEYNLRLELLKEEKIEGYISASVSKEGYISTNISKDVIFRKLLEITLDSITVLVISFLFFVELLILLFHFIGKSIASVDQYTPVHYEAVRPAAFLFLFGIDVSISFLPLHMEKLYEPIFGLSKDVVMGLPISVEMFFAGISILIAGIWLDRRRWHEPFFSGLFVTGLGILYSWLAPSALHFIASRGVVGLGYGFSLMASQGFVISHTDEKSVAQGFARFFAGVYAGSICGGAAGAMLAERIGYNPVFFFGAVIVFSVIAYALLFLRSAIWGTETRDTTQSGQPSETRRPEAQAVGSPGQSARGGQIFRFLFNRNIISLIVLSSIPAAIAVVGFLNYFSPIYLNRIGASQSNIGRIFMIYGICLIYVAPFISKYIDASRSKKEYIVISGVLGSVAFLIFYFFEGVVPTAVAVLLLGLSASFDASRAYALQLNVTHELGAGKALGIFASAIRAGQMLGPIIFGWLIVTIEINKAITYFGLGYLLLTTFFIVIAQNDRKIAITRTSAT